jgi:hypothetical protein
MKVKDDRKMEIKSVKHLQKSANKVKKGAGCLIVGVLGEGKYFFKRGGLILCQYVDP